MCMLRLHWMTIGANGQRNCKLFGMVLCMCFGNFWWNSSHCLQTFSSLAVCFAWAHSFQRHVSALWTCFSEYFLALHGYGPLPTSTSQKLFLSPLPSCFLHSSLSFPWQVSGQVRLYCECGHYPYSMQQRWNFYWHQLLCQNRPCVNVIWQWSEFFYTDKLWDTTSCFRCIFQFLSSVKDYFSRVFS